MSGKPLEFFERKSCRSKCCINNFFLLINIGIPRITRTLLERNLIEIGESLERVLFMINLMLMCVSEFLYFFTKLNILLPKSLLEAKT